MRIQLFCESNQFILRLSVIGSLFLLSFQCHSIDKSGKEYRESTLGLHTFGLYLFTPSFFSYQCNFWRCDDDQKLARIIHCRSQKHHVLVLGIYPDAALFRWGIRLLQFRPSDADEKYLTWSANGLPKPRMFFSYIHLDAILEIKITLKIRVVSSSTCILCLHKEWTRASTNISIHLLTYAMHVDQSPSTRNPTQIPCSNHLRRSGLSLMHKTF